MLDVDRNTSRQYEPIYSQKGQIQGLPRIRVLCYALTATFRGSVNGTYPHKGQIQGLADNTSTATLRDSMNRYTHTKDKSRAYTGFEFMLGVDRNNTSRQYEQYIPTQRTNTGAR
ncbi:12133_t:CDS:2 [Funneliformis geosporum]|uniref:12133_t:CDS:1 n=1 Tax=Funneliformis geosporum TaxID=1117311 RepID=A0A9W4SUB8_9GLOM|nr:12133_t:CDS:2 [Funneliformis geosporum]